MSDNKISLLINRQVPEFVRDEHPKFISFLEAYYEFLDNTTNYEGKKLRHVSDVDESLDDFEQQFFNSFLPFIPRNTALNKETLIKNIMPLYLAKGSELGYKLLFRMLFDEEIDIEYPGRQVLRASDGRWISESTLRTEPEIHSQYVSDGEKNVYYLPYVIDSSDITIYINGELITSNYTVLKEYKKIVFDVVPSLNSIIKIHYNNFDLSIFSNRRIVGRTSGASAIVEKTGLRNIGGINIFLFFINQNMILGEFQNGEMIAIDVVIENDILIPFSLLTFSEVEQITIIDGGSRYNIGDSVIIRGPSTKSAIAIVDDVASGFIEELTVTNFGAGYQVGNKVITTNFSEEFFLGSAVTTDDSGIISSNTITFNTDVVNEFANVVLSDATYGFDSFNNANIATIIEQALSSNTFINLGGITSVNVINSLISSSQSNTFTALSPIAFGQTRIGDLGVIGQIDIIAGGINYQVGDELTFVNTEYFGGQGAEALVSEISSNGTILQISIVSGGLSYNKNYLPQVNVISDTGSSANLIVRHLMGNGAEFESVLETGSLGEILSIKLLESGSGYTGTPGIDLTRSGDGNAKANTTIRNSLINLPGKWKTSDSILSSDQIKLQGLDYYIDYSYVISSSIEFEKYKNILKNLIHPAGLVNYAKYRIIEDLDANVENNIDTLVSFNTVFVGSDTTLITVDTTEFKADFS